MGELESHPEAPPFFTVGVGASAGGLEALRALFQTLDTRSLAVVVVQHLSPHHESVLPSILSRMTAAEVVEAKEGVKVEPNHVYVIPPDTNLALSKGKLHLKKDGGASHMPIDHFLHSLAADRGEGAIGVVLSGTGSDGALGLLAVKTGGGITFAQDPETAKFDAMPRAAIDNGAADFTLAPDAIATEIVTLGKRLTPGGLGAKGTEETLGKLLNLIRHTFSNDLTAYKQSTIERRIERRMALHKVDRLDDYVSYVIGNPDELQQLYKDMLINVTSFFRDGQPFDFLKSTIFPQLLEAKEPGSHLRIWVPACATGEEAYSIAMVLLEFLERRAADYRIQIFGTDVDETSINTARRGNYRANINLDVSPERLHRFFVKTETGYQVARRVRDMVVFSVQNITRDPPFSRIDLASCRNLLIYLQSPMQKRVLRVLHYALNPKGTLLLGSSETVGESSELFALVDRQARIYSKKYSPSVAMLDVGFDGHPNEAARAITPDLGRRGAANISAVADRKILELFGPPGVVVNEENEVVYFRGRTGPYVEPTPGAPSFNLFKLARPELHVDLRRAIDEAKANGARASLESRVTLGGLLRTVRLEVVPITDPETKGRALMVLFHETEQKPSMAASPPPEFPASPEAQRLQEVEHELTVTKDYLQSTIEELESGSEELKSSNEELQSSNEELQSTNEELETSKEELQSANEELTTVNDELHDRMAELKQSNDDLSNVLAGVGDAVVIVGMDLKIRRYTQTAEKMLNLVTGDVGRSVSQLNAFIQGQRIEDLAAEVIQRLVPVVREVKGTNDHWYELSIKPYRTHDHAITGAVLVLIDIEQRRQQSRLTGGVAPFANELFSVIGHPLCIVDNTRQVVWANDTFAKKFEVLREKVAGAALSRFVSEPWLDTLLGRAIDEGTPFVDFAVRGMKLSGSRIPSLGGGSVLVLLSFV